MIAVAWACRLALAVLIGGHLAGADGGCEGEQCSADELVLLQSKREHKLGSPRTATRNEGTVAAAEAEQPAAAKTEEPKKEAAAPAAEEAAAPRGFVPEVGEHRRHRPCASSPSPGVAGQPSGGHEEWDWEALNYLIGWGIPPSGAGYSQRNRCDDELVQEDKITTEQMCRQAAAKLQLRYNKPDDHDHWPYGCLYFTQGYMQWSEEAPKREDYPYMSKVIKEVCLKKERKYSLGGEIPVSAAGLDQKGRCAEKELITRSGRCADAAKAFGKRYVGESNDPSKPYGCIENNGVLLWGLGAPSTYRGPSIFLLEVCEEVLPFPKPEKKEVARMHPPPSPKSASFTFSFGDKIEGESAEKKQKGRCEGKGTIWHPETCKLAAEALQRPWGGESDSGFGPYGCTAGTGTVKWSRVSPSHESTYDYYEVCINEAEQSQEMPISEYPWSKIINNMDKGYVQDPL